MTFDSGNRPFAQIFRCGNGFNLNRGQISGSAIAQMHKDHRFIPGLVMVQFANWKMTIEIVDIAIRHGDFPVRYVQLTEGNHQTELQYVSILQA